MKTIILFELVLGALSAAGSVYIVGVDDKVTLQCGANSFTSKLQWTHQDQLVLRLMGRNSVPSKGKIPISRRANTVRDTELAISRVEDTDSGRFTCSVDSKKFDHTLIVVSVSVAPSGVLPVGSKATLECKANSPDAPPNVQWRKPDGSVQVSPKVELSSVAPSDEGTWQCTVSQQDKTFTKNVTIHVKEPDPEPTTPALKKHPKPPKSEGGQNSTGGGGVSPWSEDAVHLMGLVWWVWVAIGAGGLVVIILIVVIIILNKRNRRRRRKFLRMNKAQLSQKPKKYCQCVRQTAAAKPQQGRRREKPSALPLQPLLQE